MGGRQATTRSSLRALLTAPRLACLVEAHDALSARIASEAGVDGIWASSLTLSAARGVPDNGSITMTEALDTLEAMAEHAHVPILFDGDHGYGDLHQFQRLVPRLERRGIGGVCIEDKRFPKRNSFLQSEAQELADVDEMCAKLRAGKDAQRTEEFVIVARTEALVTGLSVQAALDRADKYVDAGADAVLVHAKDPTFAKVHAFMSGWQGRAPVICVPTTYYGTPIEAFETAGVSMIIWANHLLRASITAMQAAAREIASTRSARTLEDDIAPLTEVFRLQDAHDLERNERAYLTEGRRTRAIVLAATRGQGLEPLTEDRPKAMISIGGEPVIERLVRQLRAEGVRDLGVVRGYRAEALAPVGVRCFDNPRWAETGEIASLACAADMLDGDVVVAYGDLLLRQHLVHELMGSEAPITILVDGTKRGADASHAARDRVWATHPERPLTDDTPVYLRHVGPDVHAADVHGVFMGLLRVRHAGMSRFRAAVERVLREPGGERAELSAVLNVLAREDATAVRVLYVRGAWTDVNSMLDVARGNG